MSEGGGNYAGEFVDLAIDVGVVVDVVERVGHV